MSACFGIFHREFWGAGSPDSGNSSPKLPLGVQPRLEQRPKAFPRATSPQSDLAPMPPCLDGNNASLVGDPDLIRRKSSCNEGRGWAGQAAAEVRLCLGPLQKGHPSGPVEFSNVVPQAVRADAPRHPAIAGEGEVADPLSCERIAMRAGSLGFRVSQPAGGKPAGGKQKRCSQLPPATQPRCDSLCGQSRPIAQRTWARPNTGPASFEARVHPGLRYPSRPTPTTVGLPHQTRRIASQRRRLVPPASATLPSAAAEQRNWKLSLDDVPGDAHRGETRSPTAGERGAPASSPGGQGVDGECNGGESENMSTPIAPHLCPSFRLWRPPPEPACPQKLRSHRVAACPLSTLTALMLVPSRRMLP